jgi:hypothetical protein
LVYENSPVILTGCVELSIFTAVWVDIFAPGMAVGAMMPAVGALVGAAGVQEPTINMMGNKIRPILDLADIFFSMMGIISIILWQLVAWISCILLKCPLNIMDNHDLIQVTLDGELYLWIIEVTK